MNGYHSLITDLEEAISCGPHERRLATLWSVTDLFVAGAGQYADEHVDLFDDVIGRLAAQIEVIARAKLALRLAPIPNAPINVIRVLAFDDVIDVAGPVLAQSPRLDDATLIDTAKIKSQDHLLAIAQRRGLSETVTDILVDRGDQRVVRSVTRNAGARFSDAAFGMLTKRAMGDDVLAELAGMRKDIPRHHFHKLMAKASHVVREKLAAANPDAARQIQDAIAEIVSNIESKVVNGSPDYIAATNLIGEIRRAGTLNENHLHSFARAHKSAETIVCLAKLCGLSIEVVERAMLDDRLEMVLILAKAIGASWTTAKSILLLRTDGRGMSAQDLDRALYSYERLGTAAAQRVVRFYQMRQRSQASACVA
jgi:uncharacterized protein (DUF2336 family)